MERLVMLLLLLLFLSCSSNKEEITKIDHVNFEHVDIDLTLGRVSALVQKDSFIIIADVSADSLFYLVNLANNSFSEKGPKGQGPYEYLGFDNFSYVDNKIGFYDRRLRSYSSINFERKPDTFEFNKTVKFDSVHYHVTPTAFNYFVGIGPYQTGLFKIISLEGKIEKTFFEQPYRDDEERQISEQARAMAYQGRIVCSPDGKRLVHAITMSQIISFYKLTSHNMKLVKSCVDEYPEYRPELGQNSYASAMKRSNKLGYLDVVATNQFVYALLSGRSTQEHGLSAFLGNQILVYNWDGDLVRKLITDIDMKSIFVSSNDEILYSVGIADDYELLKAPL